MTVRLTASAILTSRPKTAPLKAVDAALQTALADLHGVDAATLRSRRREKFLAMGREPVA